jgi:hypothetical protein
LLLGQPLRTSVLRRALATRPSGSFVPPPPIISQPKSLLISAEAVKGIDMGKLFRFLLLLAVCVIAFGFYRGWFGVSTNRDATGGQSDVKVRIDEKKIESDTERAKEKVKGAIDRTLDKHDAK